MRLVLAVTLSLACCPSVWSETPKPTSPKAAASGPGLSDAALQQKIQDKFAHSKAGGGKFTVKVSGGVAYLGGRADVVQHKGAATRMAKSAGAKRVVNNIQVSEAARQKAAQSLHSDKPRQAQVKTASE